MEKRIMNKVNVNNANFRNTIQKWFSDNNATIIFDSNSSINKNKEFLEFLYSYKFSELELVDFEKRKRIKNQVPQYDQCKAKKANNQRCTRRKQANCEYCGTHIKGTPHGIIEANSIQQNKQKVEVWVQDIKGINSYIDADNNIYNPEDIISNKENPSIIAQWILNEDGEYNIPSLDMV
tara:strand:+ start:221 stop:757 length:537 start_codon:yes stop_codon:yes gene_type:complete